MLNIQSPDGLITTVIKQKKEVYYLLTSDNISSIKSKSILTDVFIALASLLWGAVLSVETTLISFPPAKDSLDPLNNVILKLEIICKSCFVGGIIFTILAMVLLYQSYKEIRSHKTDSEEISNINENAATNLPSQ